MGKDGKSKYQGRSKSVVSDARMMIAAARDKTAKELGYKDYDDALKTKLKESGLEVYEPTSREAWQELKQEGASPLSNRNTGFNLFKLVEQCKKDFNTLPDPNSGVGFSPSFALGSAPGSVPGSEKKDDTSKLQEVIQKHEAFQKKYMESIVGLYAKDLPLFFSQQIAKTCQEFNSDPNWYKPKDNQKISNVCGKIGSIDRQAVLLFRREGTSQYKAAAEKFVRDNWLPPLRSPQSLNFPRQPSKAQNSAQLEKLQQELEMTVNTSRDTCSTYSGLAVNAGRKVVSEAAIEINKSKTTVDAVIDSFYTENRRKLADRILKETRTDIQGITSQFVKDPKTLTDISIGYDSLKLYWMEKPPESAYKKNVNGKLVLDEDKVPESFSRLFKDEVISVFSDPSLSFFKDMNADYMPAVTLGKLLHKEHVNLMPTLLLGLEKNPYSHLMVAAHEIAHKVGPENMRLHGADLRPEYQKLIDCYRNSKSINLQKNQAEEAIPDYISSEILANQIAKLPKEKRKQALMSSMEPYCIFKDDYHRAFSIQCKENHPEPSLRVSGIFGANPNLRKVIGCKGESSQFQSCGMNVSLLSTSGSDGNNSPGTSKLKRPTGANQ